SAVVQKRNSLFRVGFLKADMEPLLDEVLFHRMKKYLEQQNSVKESLNESGLTSIVVLPVDGFHDMVRRMNIQEFDLVFCSATVYVRQTGNYEAILQLRRQRDIWDARGGGKVLQKGALIISCSQWKALGENPDPETIRQFLLNSRLAVVSIYSAPGYIFPLLKLRRDYGISPLGSLIFCDSSEEVVKYVISGLAPAGCCEISAIEEVIQQAGLKVSSKDLIKILFETEPIPTNPVVIRSIYHPRKSKLGRELKTALRTYFSQLPPNIPRLEHSQDDYFNNLREVITSFDEIKE
ncbi:MAG: phosphate/phosphite/phosphonate ABC transporter substrate-binding protein, partial [Candidatus Sumerlaeia bacterium]|nr:phosphate/phosphite/phosphonate ABC transporter substrate-binding protein [Candidatus Sumerlaeia bacterium]